MSKKSILVVFTPNNARVLVNADPGNYPDALVNPDLSAVRAEPPHFWKLKDGKIVPMNRFEKRARLMDHKLSGVVNDFGAPRPTRARRVRNWARALSPLWLAIAGALIGWCLHG